MAIIYTYPKLQNPQGNELIVVTDVNNKNATRLITIASIASLVPGGGGGGCSSAISGILTGAGSYIPPLCNEVTFAGSGGISIEADQATATVTFTNNQTCATNDKIGGVKVSETLISPEQEIQLSETGVHYALQVSEDCVAGVRIPASSGIQCATSSALGGIKAQDNQTQLSVPSISDDGIYYPIELMKNAGVVTGADCTAIVKIPSSEPIACATPDALGGIYANSVTLPTGNPSTADSGSYYPVQLITGSDTDDCFPVVRVPDANDGTLTITVDGTPSTFTANQAGNTNVSITTGGSGGSTDNGFTPLSIYDGKSGQGAGVQETLWCQTVVEDACVINKVDYGAIGGNSQNLTVALYKGTLSTVAGGTAVLIGWGEITTTAVGINTIDLSDDGTSSGNDIVIEAGDDIVIGWSKPSTVGGIIGKGAGDTPAQFWLGQILTGASFTASDLTLGETVSTTQGNLSEDPPSNANVYRLSWHFYKGESASNPTQRFEYQKCASAEGTACTNMPPAVILEAEQSLLLDYLILENSANRNESCCYFKVAESTATVTPNISIKDQFENCDSLPDECVE